MFYIIPTENNAPLSKVRAVISNPFPEQLEDGGFYAEMLPKAETPEGMHPVLMVNNEIREIWYAYEAIPEPPKPENTLAVKLLENTNYLIDLDYRLSLIEMDLS